MIRPAAFPERLPSYLDETAHAVDAARRRQWLLAAVSVLASTLAAIATTAGLDLLAVGCAAATVTSLCAHTLMRRRVDHLWNDYIRTIAAETAARLVMRRRGSGT